MVRAVLKSYCKNILREMKDNLSRMVSLFGIVALGVMMLTGLMSFAPSMRIAGQKYYVQQNVFDLRVLSTLGLSEEEVRRSYTAHAARHRSTTQYFTQQVRAAAGLILDHDPPGELAVQQAGDLVTSAAMIGGLSRLLAEKLLLLEGRTLENGGSIQIEQPGNRDL